MITAAPLVLLAWAAPPAETDASIERPPYRTLRYQEDFSALPHYRGPADVFDPIKHVRLDEQGKHYFSFGGEFRSRYEYFNQPSFGFDGDRDDFLLLRGLVHADLHLGRHFRGFAQASSLSAIGAEQPSPLDVNALALQQGFLELRVPLAGGQALSLRAGRQEVALGSSRLVAIRKGPNFRRSFDMLRFGYSHPRMQIDALAGLTIEPGPRVLDDLPSLDDALWGVYATFTLVEAGKLGLDAYYLGVRRSDRTYTDAAGLELRHSIGARLFGRAGGVDYDFEAVIQAGSVGEAELLAWTVASNTGYTFADREFSARLGLKADVTSGDRRLGDGRLGTFDALYPNLKYFNEAGLFVPSNLMDLHPVITIGYDRLSLSTDLDFAWRTSTSDAVYGPPDRVTIAGDATDARYLGHQLTSELGLACGLHLDLTFYYAHFFSGPIVREIGGRDVDFFGTWIEYTF